MGSSPSDIYYLPGESEARVAGTSQGRRYKTFNPKGTTSETGFSYIPGEHPQAAPAPPNHTYAVPFSNDKQCQQQLHHQQYYQQQQRHHSHTMKYPPSHYRRQHPVTSSHTNGRAVRYYER